MKKLIFLFCLTMLPALVLFACSDSTLQTELPTPGLDAGRDSAHVSADAEVPDAAVVVDAAVECGAPAHTFPFGDGGLFCPFSGVDGGPNKFCKSLTEQCCETPSTSQVDSTCEPRGTVCPVANSTPWECAHVQDCAGAQQCCAYGGPVSFNEGACDPFLSKFNGTRCEAKCAAGELVVCAVDSDCPDGQKCRAVRPKGGTIGVCR